jgi:hypothetical protein
MTTSLALSLLVVGCDSVNRHVVGPQAASGVMRLSPESFGLLIFPCHNALVSEVQLGELNYKSQAFTPILREVYEPPVLASGLVVSTDPTKVTPGAQREVIDPALLTKVNTDPTFMTEPWPPQPESGLAVRALAPGKVGNIAGSAAIPLAGRFDLKTGEVDVYGRAGQLKEFRCSGEHGAWQPTNESAVAG